MCDTSILFVCVRLKHQTLGSGKNIGLGAGECGAEEGGWVVTGYWKVAGY